MERGKGHGADNSVIGGGGVGKNGIDIGRVDVVVDGVDMVALNMLASQVLLLLKATPKGNTISGIQQHSSSGTQTSKCYHGHVQVITDQQATQPACQTLGTIQ